MAEPPKFGADAGIGPPQPCQATRSPKNPSWSSCSTYSASISSRYLDLTDRDRKRDAEEDDDRDSKRTKVEASERISSADYFAKNAPFTRWLRKKKVTRKIRRATLRTAVSQLSAHLQRRLTCLVPTFPQGVYFDQLNAGRSRELFDDFVVKWNEGSLSSKYYTMDPIKPKSKERTGYTWSFVNKLDKSDKKGLQQLSDSVEESLTHDALGSGGAVPRSTPIPGAASTAAPARGSEKPARRVMLPAAPDAETLKAYSAQLQQKERRDYRAQDKLAHDEITGGKATGFERKLEKKADARAERLAREASPGVCRSIRKNESINSDSC